MYKILRTDKAEDQLRDIIYYIAADSDNIDIALTYLAKIEQSINRLKEFPNSGTIPRYFVLKKQGYRVLTVEKHSINEENKTVIIYAIVDGRREYINLI